MKGVGSLFGELKALQQARYNIAPSQQVLVRTHDRAELQLFRWGLIPFWAKDEKIGYSLINARAETLAKKPAFREALAKRRCLVPADGFYEWWKNADSGKTPFYIRMKTEAPFAFAGLWETWRGPAGELIKSCTIITTPANVLLRPIHDRMPAIMPPKHFQRWLDPEQAAPAVAAELLKPYPARELEAIIVSRQVNSVKNDSAALIAPEREPEKKENGLLF
jgi:putative SOS response-associated peptidase YedK